MFADEARGAWLMLRMIRSSAWWRQVGVLRYRVRQISICPNAAIWNSHFSKYGNMKFSFSQVWQHGIPFFQTWKHGIPFFQTWQHGIPIFPFLRSAAIKLPTRTLSLSAILDPVAGFSSCVPREGPAIK